jgi:opacity protein-like surface antigen
MRRAIPALLAATALAGALPAAAQEEEASKWSFAFTPYLWATTIDGTVTGPGGRDVDFASSFSDLVKKLDFAFMGAGEVRYDRFGLVLDVAYSSLSGEQDTPFGVLFGKAEVDLKQWIINSGLAYRFYRDRVGWIDATAGARILIIDTDVTLTPGVLDKQTSNLRKTIASPIIGMRAHIDIIDGFGLTGAFDVGGFGLGADFTWQVLASVDYEISEGIALRTGYRAIGLNYTNDGGTEIDYNLSGPVVGVTFRF